MLCEFGRTDCRECRHRLFDDIAPTFSAAAATHLRHPSPPARTICDQTVTKLVTVVAKRRTPDDQLATRALMGCIIVSSHKANLKREDRMQGVGVALFGSPSAGSVQSRHRRCHSAGAGSRRAVPIMSLFYIIDLVIVFQAKVLPVGYDGFVEPANYSTSQVLKTMFGQHMNTWGQPK